MMHRVRARESQASPDSDRGRPARRRAPTRLLAAALATAVLALLGWLGWRSSRDAELPAGRALNELAFERTFTERDLPVPAAGPREGFWGARTAPKQADPVTNWRERLVSIPSLVEIDGQGLQHDGSEAAGVPRVLILGGSVAFGSNASCIEATWFHRLRRELEQRAGPVHVVVAAGGAWKVVQELAWLQEHVTAVRPSLVVFLDGLNDLPNGARSDTLFSQPVPTCDGRPFDPQHHEHDDERRVADCLELLRCGQQIARAHGARTLFALQPSLAEKEPLSPIEARLLQASLGPLGPVEALNSSYEALREGLRRLADAPDAAFVDLSRAFDGEARTTFTDLWHFTDPGHARVADLLAPEAARLLGR